MNCVIKPITMYFLCDENNMMRNNNGRQVTYCHIINLNSQMNKKAQN